MWIVYVWKCQYICFHHFWSVYTISECYDTCLCVYWQKSTASILTVNNIVSFCLTCFLLLLLSKELQKVQTKLLLFCIWSGMKWEFETICLWFCFSNVFMKVMVSHRHSSLSPFSNSKQISKFLEKSQRAKEDT